MMSSVYPRGNILWLRFKDAKGGWTSASSGFALNQEAEAKAALKLLESHMQAKAAAGDVDDGPMSVERYIVGWLKSRVGVVVDVKSDESRLRMHVLPVIGTMVLDEVRPRHLIELFAKLRTGSLAPKTIWNVYAVVKALFRDAMLADLVTASPCILTEQQLGPMVDADPEWRPTAVFTRDELVALISDPRIPVDRHVAWGLLGLAGLRHGEMAGLRWRHYDHSQPVLGRLVIATSYDTGTTKTKRPRLVPVHPTLAALLTEWRPAWVAMMGREPGPDDLIVPLPKPTNRGRRVEAGAMRSDHNSYKRLMGDLAMLGFRHRRVHDLRRTMISLARGDGARADILEICTHNPGKSGRTIDLYTSFTWESLCAEIQKLLVVRTPTSAGPARCAENAPAGLATVLAPVIVQVIDDQQDHWWRRRESNPRPKEVVVRPLHA